MAAPNPAITQSYDRALAISDGEDDPTYHPILVATEFETPGAPTTASIRDAGDRLASPVVVVEEGGQFRITLIKHESNFAKYIRARAKDRAPVAVFYIHHWTKDDPDADGAMAVGETGSVQFLLDGDPDASGIAASSYTASWTGPRTEVSLAAAKVDRVNDLPVGLLS